MRIVYRISYANEAVLRGVQDLSEVVGRARDGAGRPVLAPTVLSQIIKYLPQLLPLIEDLLRDLTARLRAWYVGRRYSTTAGCFSACIYSASFGSLRM